jgi:hypothetical protein
MSGDESGHLAAPASANRAHPNVKPRDDCTERSASEPHPLSLKGATRAHRHDQQIDYACRPDVAIKAKVDPRNAGGAARRTFIALERAGADVVASKDQARLSRSGRRAFHKARPSLKRAEP